MHLSADELIEKLHLRRHPEGGWFCETYRSEEKIPAGSLPERFDGDHCFSTCINFLLKSGELSKLHRLKADEIWHFYAGCPLKVIYIAENGELTEAVMGGNIREGQVFQFLMPAGVWMGAYPLEENSFSLTGCTVAPGFEFQDFELAERSELLRKFPQHESIINLLT